MLIKKGAMNIKPLCLSW